MYICRDLWENTDDTVHECILPDDGHTTHRSNTHTWTDGADVDAAPL